MVRTRVRGNLRMPKQNTKTTVPLDVAPECRTKRFSPRFRPVSRFCELRLRYLSSLTGRKGEISRPLDHIFFFFLKNSFIEKSRDIHNKITPKKASVNTRFNVQVFPFETFFALVQYDLTYV